MGLENQVALPLTAEDAVMPMEVPVELILTCVIKVFYLNNEERENNEVSLSLFTNNAIGIQTRERDNKGRGKGEFG